MDEKDYVERLVALQDATWKKLLRVQAPYQMNIRRLCVGPTVDVGCGIGRNMGSLPGASVGVDTNSYAVSEARRRGHSAFTPEEFRAKHVEGAFGTLLFSHVLEHMTIDEGATIMRDFVRYLAPGGRVVVICPQERGFDSDVTHVEFLDFGAIEAILRSSEIEPSGRHSFPLPRGLGRIFIYNEFVVVGRRPMLATG